MAKNGQAYKNPIPASTKEEVNTSEQPKDNYTYVPSPTPVVVNGVSPDLTPAEAALRKADMMEQKVAETLSMRR